MESYITKDQWLEQWRIKRPFDDRTYDEIPDEHPSDFFRPKPVVTSPYRDVDLETLRPVVVKSIKDGTISSDLAALFLWKLGDRFKGKLTETWESLDAMISRPGVMNLGYVIKIVYGSKEIPSLPQKMEMVSSKDDNWIASFLTSIYRINHAENENHKSELSKEALNILIKNCGSVLNTNLDFMNIRYANWVNDVNYCKIIAAYDMFLLKTNIKEYQFLRWGTMSSRYKDCAVLENWIDISKSCGYTNLSDLKKWVFVDSICKEVERILTNGNEIDKPDSYMPYYVCLLYGWSRSSVYSCSVNPSLAMFLSTMKVYLGEKGASNAKDYRCDRHDVCFNGLIVAYVLRKKYCSANKTTENLSVSFESDPVLEAVSTPDELFAYLKNKRYSDVINGPLEKFKKSIDATIINPKPRTVGFYLTNSFK